ncbi:F0F1 ATP synthase subunit delta [Paenibacillus thiaminolyticus]|uniref:ATP synthase subunit delta n=1 Tax=Paenibacillus thiaminolyticus TaxID=49283 RepID=A0A3A3GJI8_PANTH|nr:F0F1 ATP synthase subunit delta [Paenibacillus thiaminolyticus]RJG24892.1 F0F1 ATP synthase subunit delta [Paenibacillus thiaminolyticus]
MSKDIAKRYAKALFDLASERKAVAETEQQLKAVVEVMNSTSELYVLFSAPNIDVSVKQAILRQAFEGEVSEIVLNTLLLLTERGRIRILPDLETHFVRIVGEATGVTDAYVTTAFPLDEAGKQEVAAQFGQILNKTIRVHNVVDASIIGGMKVRIGDVLYDGSLFGQLERIQKTLKTQVR